MEVKINSKSKILKDILGFMPMAIGCLFFYWFIFAIVFFTVLKNFMAVDVARTYSNASTVVACVLALFFYIRYLNKTFSSYILQFDSGKIIIGGSSGWRLVRTEVDLSSIRTITIGQNLTKFQRFSSIANPGPSKLLRDIKAGVLIFEIEKEKPLKIQFANRVFEEKSLVEFLTFLKISGVQIESVV